MKKYADATDQDDLIEIFSDVYLLRGSIKLGPLLQMNRNMVIVREGHDLIIINAVFEPAELRKIKSAWNSEACHSFGGFSRFRRSVLHRYLPS